MLVLRLFAFDSLSSHCQAVSPRENQTTTDTPGKVSVFKEIDKPEATCCRHTATREEAADANTFRLRTQFAEPRPPS